MTKSTYSIEVDGKSVKLTAFRNPMMHEDWHEAEAAGLVYACYLHHGPDGELIFCKKEDYELVQRHRKETEW